ncbi:hypothetical protein ES703_43074 [subsurface metagenome]|jgi:hypothetical protein
MTKFLMVAIAAVVVGSLLASPVLAKPPSGASMGAVKLALHERMPGDLYFEEGSGSRVGWAIVNTNADGELIVQTHLDNGEENQTFDVYVRINDEWHPADVGSLTTNRQGKGNAHAELNLADYPPSTEPISVQVVVKPTGATAIIGYATATESVPLKK